MTKLSIKKFKEALKGSHGVQAVIAKKCGVERATITNFLDKHPKMRILCIAEREKIIDVAENRLFKAADNGEKWAVDKILATIGKDRGYVEKQQVEHSGEREIIFQEVVLSDEEIKKRKNDKTNNPKPETA